MATKVYLPEVDVPLLEGWLTAEQVSREVGVSRSIMWRWFAEGVFATMHAVGDRPLYVVREEEVARLKQIHAKLARARAWAEATRLLQAEAPKWRSRKRW